MHKVKVNGDQYTYPDSWGGLTVAQFDRLQNHLKSEDTPGIKQMVGVYSIVTGIPEAVFLEAPKDFYLSIGKTLKWLDTPPDTPPELSQTIAGIKYSFPITLNDISLGEFADLDEVLKMDNQVNAGILAVLFRPEGEKYDSANFYKRRAFWGEQSAGAVLPVISFFLRIGGESLTPTKTFSPMAAGVVSELMRVENLVKNGVGSRRRLTLREGIYLKLIRYYKKTLSRFLIS